LHHGFGTKIEPKKLRRYSAVHIRIKKFSEISCKKAIQEEIENNEKKERPILNLIISGDDS